MSCLPSVIESFRLCATLNIFFFFLYLFLIYLFNFFPLHFVGWFVRFCLFVCFAVKEHLFKWEWEPASVFWHKWAPHSSPAADTGWVPSESDARDEGEGVLQRPEGWLQSVKGPDVRVLAGIGGQSLGTCTAQSGITSNKFNPQRCTLDEKPPLPQLQGPLNPNTSGPEPEGNNTWLRWKRWCEQADMVMKKWEKKTN